MLQFNWLEGSNVAASTEFDLQGFSKTGIDVVHSIR
jgi:hypothetical protein